ncbi:MAG: carbohydrate binding family 9 domain-containing protein [Candidatus Eisenbacteria bacterium]
MDKYVLRRCSRRAATPRVAATAIAVLALSLVMRVPAAQADGERAVKTPDRIPKIANDVKIDGVLDEAVWERALVMGVNNEVRPGNNIPAPVETDMLLAYSETHFYVAFRAYDPDPSRIYAHLCDHDEMWNDEWVVIGIDTYNDQRGGYEFACNPLGIQGDTASGVHGDGNSWDGIWDSAGKIFDWGYSVEMAIPFSSLRFQRVDGDQIWGVDAVRSYPREVRRHISLYPRDRDDNCYRCQMDKLVGFEGATPGRNIEIDPTVSAAVSQFREGDSPPYGEFMDAEENFDVGVTARWGITPNTTLSTYVNPDSPQVEPDAFQLDVNRRYALNYEEKRPFFLESSGAFNSFYSRAIVSPAWAAKITDKAGDNTFGALVARDELTSLIIAGNQGSSDTVLDLESTATALRYARDVGDMSSISTYYNGREGDGYHNRVAGAETEFWFTDNDKIEVQVEGSYTQYPDAVLEDPEIERQPASEFYDRSYQIETGHFTSGLDVYANYTDVGDNFRTDLDYMPHVGYRHLETGAGRTWQRESGSWWTMLNLGGCYNYQEFQDGTKSTRGSNFWMNYQGPKQSFADISGWFGTTAFAGKEFDTWELNFDAGFWPSSALFAFIDASYGETIDYRNASIGHRFSAGPHVELKLGSGLSSELGHAYEHFTEEGDNLYTANVSFLKTVYQFNRRMFVRGILQYRDTAYNTDYYPANWPEQREQLSSQVLLSYKVNPQTVFFLGYSDSHEGNQDIDLTQSGRTLFAKIGYAWVL